MTLRGRDWLRAFALKTNPYWPFRFCNRVPYALALRAVKLAWGRRSEIQGIHVRNSLAGRQWIPGTSDIDLGVTVQNGLPARREFELTEFLWHTYDRLSAVFPMLGEVVILEEAEFPLWRAYSRTTPEVPPVVPLYGKTVPVYAVYEGGRWRARALNAALWTYLNLVLPYLAGADSYLGWHDLRRRVRRVLRYLEPAQPEGMPSVGDLTEPCHLVAAALTALERAAAAISPAACPTTSSEDGGIRGVILDGKGCLWAVLENGLGSGRIARLLAEHARPRPGTGAGPVLLPHRLFAYMVRHYRPFAYSELQRSRTILRGEDPIPRIEPPGRSELAAYTLDLISYLLTITRGEELFSQRHAFPLQVLKRAVCNGLAVRLLLQEQWVAAGSLELAARCESKFPECFQTLAAIEGLLALGREREARRAAFHLFRPIAGEIRDLAAPRLGESGAGGRERTSLPDAIAWPAG